MDKYDRSYRTDAKFKYRTTIQHNHISEKQAELNSCSPRFPIFEKFATNRVDLRTVLTVLAGPDRDRVDMFQVFPFQMFPFPELPVQNCLLFFQKSTLGDVPFSYVPSEL